MTNSIENSPERIPTRDEILEVISRFAEHTTIVRELSDEQGLYLLEAKLEGTEPPETTQYEYRRRGQFLGCYGSSGTVIHRVYYRNGVAYEGNHIANYNHETDEWLEVK